MDAVIRWGDDGQVTVLWEMESSTYGFVVAPQLLDQMNIGEGDVAMAPVVMQLMVFDA